ncbi:sugar phosphate isomerase/epimerase family protein [Tessaracoccus palaemonis]|uniref:Sugar phosphate isomerase/epimerase n=1 Tax=Tessaracoccus palaemonis TaxID=2829499 RepID=A0ABX8SK44_9ACTN|nr:sugar phosphate isomerase/epimerase family protein [Tessaracoccus palaemonis]QXT63716.1 sugar phosphate isomerase/epimerase [Tessaracoccus palaemonis]
MTGPLRLAAQESMLAGDTLQDKFETAIGYGFDGIELQIKGEGRFTARRADLIAARSAGVIMPSACFNTSEFLGSVDPAVRRRAIDEMAAVIPVLADAGVRGFVTPNGCEIASKYHSGIAPTLTDLEARRLLVDGLREIAAVAERAGVRIYLEPLNRYEDYVVNTVDQALAVIDEVGSAAVMICADTYHMSLEEKRIPEALTRAGARLGHVQLGDSERSEPGGGHYDWAATLQALRGIGYDGWMSLECFLSGPPSEVIPPVATLLRGLDTTL